MEVALEVRNVCKTFNSKRAVDDVCLTLGPGEVFGLLGPNGAGKTTLIRMIMDILKPDRGDIRLFGDQSSADARDRIGYLPEERGLYLKQRVDEVLRYFARLNGLSRQDANARIDTLLRGMGLADCARQKVEQLSKGMQQKVQFVAAVIHDPGLVVLDEPFVGLDPVSRKLLKRTILDMAASGKSVLLSTHEMAPVETLCDRIAMIHHGRRVLYGNLQEVKRAYSSNAVVVTSDADYGSFDSITTFELEGSSAKIELKNGTCPNILE